MYIATSSGYVNTTFKFKGTRLTECVGIKFGYVNVEGEPGGGRRKHEAEIAKDRQRSRSEALTMSDCSEEYKK